MKRSLHHPIRPIEGALAAGLIAFGLGLQGAPAGDDDRPEAASFTNVKEAAQNTSMATARIPGGDVRPEEEVNPLADLAGDGLGLGRRGDAGIRLGQEISVVPVASAGRAIGLSAPGGLRGGAECDCDSDCEPGTGRENCTSYKCVYDGALG